MLDVFHGCFGPFSLFLLNEDGLIFAVNGDSSNHFTPLRGFVLGYSTKQILDSFSPTQKVSTWQHAYINKEFTFNQPHTLLNKERPENRGLKCILLLQILGLFCIFVIVLVASVLKNAKSVGKH